MYGKIFAQMFTGTLHGRLEAAATFMALIALADREGTVDMTLATLTALTGWPKKFIESGIRQLEEPDEQSRTPDEDGRRLIRLRDNTEWGWKIVNYKKYREIRDESDRREYMRNYMRQRRERESVNQCKQGKQKLAYAEAEAYKETPLPPGNPKPQTRVRAKKPKSTLPDGFALDLELLEYAKARLPGVDTNKLLESFCGKARAKSWVYSDWRHAFQEFVRNCAPNSGHWASGQYPKTAAAGGWV